MAVQQGRSEQRGESYSGLYVEPLSDARTTLVDFFSILLDLPAGPDQDVTTLNPNFIAPHTISPAIRPLAISNVKRQIMPRTCDHKTFEPSFNKRPPFMGATVMDRKKLSFDIE